MSTRPSHLVEKYVRLCIEYGRADRDLPATDYKSRNRIMRKLIATKKAAEKHPDFEIAHLLEHQDEYVRWIAAEHISDNEPDRARREFSALAASPNTTLAWRAKLSLSVLDSKSTTSTQRHADKD